MTSKKDTLAEGSLLGWRGGGRGLEAGVGPWASHSDDANTEIQMHYTNTTLVELFRSALSLPPPLAPCLSVAFLCAKKVSDVAIGHRLLRSHRAATLAK